MFNGEGDKDMGRPDLMLFSTTCSSKTEMLCPNDTEVQSLLTSKGALFGRHLLAPRLVTTSQTILKIAPIPAYLVYDAFETTLNAADVYERLLHSAHDNPMIAHAKNFLKAHLVGPLRNEDDKPYVAQDEWNQSTPKEAKLWR